MTPNEYQKNCLRTECNQEFSLARMGDFNTTPLYGDDGLRNIRLNHALAGISKQGGELWRVLIKHVYYGQPLDVVNLKEELGDVLWHVAQACTVMGLTMEQVMAANLAKLKERYPQRFTEERASNRDLDAERKALMAEEAFKLSDEYRGRLMPDAPVVPHHDIGGES